MKELWYINWLFTWYTGRNDCGQLGQGDLNRRDLPTEVPLLQGLNIVDACCGKNHTLFLTGKKYYLKPCLQKIVMMVGTYRLIRFKAIQTIFDMSNWTAHDQLYEVFCLFACVSNVLKRFRYQIQKSLYVLACKLTEMKSEGFGGWGLMLYSWLASIPG